MINKKSQSTMPIYHQKDNLKLVSEQKEADKKKN